MGHGIVTPYLEAGTKKRILILGFVYWIFAFLFEVFIHYHETNEVSPQLRLILTPPVAILDEFGKSFTPVCFLLSWHFGDQTRTQRNTRTCSKYRPMKTPWTMLRPLMGQIRWMIKPPCSFTCFLFLRKLL